MSPFAIHPSRRPFSLVRALLLALLLVGGYVLVHPDAPQTATISGAVRDDLTLPTATVFAQPSAVAWEGVVTRTLAGGRGIEVKSPQTQAGYFVAYDDEGIPASAAEGLVRVSGRWTGISCEYGRCMPEVDIGSVEPLRAELE